MNGQTARLDTARRMIHQLAIERIIETGTYRGTTTEWLASFGLPITTIEISPRFHSFARRRLRHLPNVELRFGESTEVLRELVGHVANQSAPTFFYLDAHWYDHLPLAEELKIISSHFGNAFVMVDDFQIPNDAGYGYDDYGPDKRLTLDYVSSRFSRALYPFFPRAKAMEETGNRRGWVVFAFDEENAARLKKIPGLEESTRREMLSGR